MDIAEKKKVAIVAANCFVGGVETALINMLHCVDRSVHQAVQQVESDELESGKIASVFQNGYRLGTKVLRFAMVTVVS